MVLYTPIAEEDIFSDSKQQDMTMRALWVEGRLCLVRRDGFGIMRMERLLSTDPADYLEPCFQPDAPVALT